ncbi:MAG TPA: hypothetical protein VGO50_20475 [Pyrinomonadaceae bacterium]|jgi:hypothetical protein|nr:hypothetical protein [Pyrinomonadaceae bacterium]
MNRNITGTIRKTDGAVWAGAAVEFELERSSYDDSAQYPMHVVRAVADENGEIALTLWINEEALRPSRYICTMPDGCQFRFTLPEGVGDADLATLRESAIEEDSPTQSTLVAFLPAVRVEAQQVVDQAVVVLNAAIDAKADQTALDTVSGDLAALDAEVDTKAGQLALDTTNANVSDLADSLFSANSSILSLSNGLTAANSAIATKADQSALNTTNANVTTLTTGLAAANTAIATKANQSSLNTTNSNLAALDAEVDSLVLELETKAKQISLDATDANVGQLTGDLDALSHEVGNKASQADLDNTNSSVAALDAVLDTTVTNLAAANTAIATKANQSSLNTTNANVTTLTDGLATANADIATRARQTALNTTNSNVTALSGVVDTKASELALNAAISNLEDAISAAQTTLETLIDQKADLAHIHESADIHNDVENAVGYFNSSGDLSGSDQFVFAGGMIGLGTADPEYTVDLRHPNADGGNQSRVTMILNSPGPIIQMNADPSSPSPATINMDGGGGMVNTIDSDSLGILGLGTEGLTPAILFRTVNGQLSFFGIKTGFDEPQIHDFENGTFGFFVQSNLIIGGDPNDDVLYLVVYNHYFKTLIFK